MFIAANTRRPAIGSRVFELAEYFEMVFLEILPSVQVTGFPRASHMFGHKKGIPIMAASRWAILLSTYTYTIVYKSTVMLIVFPDSHKKQILNLKSFILTSPLLT